MQKKSEFKSGEHVYILDVNGGIDWCEGTVLNYSPAMDRYCIDLERNSSGEDIPRCMAFFYGGVLFRTKSELFKSCVEYCSGRESYWRGRAEEFSELIKKEEK